MKVVEEKRREDKMWHLYHATRVLKKIKLNSEKPTRRLELGIS